MTCYCSRCVPTTAEVVCSACGSEIRWGRRHGRMAWWHQGEVEHAPILGHRAIMGVPTGDADEGEVIPPVEVPCHPVEPDSLPPRSGLRQVINLAARQGWERKRLTHARGPYMGGRNQVLSISDSVVLEVHAPRELDGSYRWAVASWRDSKFDFAFIGTARRGARLEIHGVDATTLKNWIKGTHDLQPPVQPSREEP